jgi:hypothetical protein
MNKKSKHNVSYTSSIFIGHSSLVNDIDWNKALQKAIKDKMLVYHVIDYIDGKNIIEKAEFLNMTHLVDDKISEEVNNLRFKLGLLSIEY